MIMKAVVFVLFLFAQLLHAQNWETFLGYEYLVVFTPLVNSYSEAEAGCREKSATVANVKTTELYELLKKKTATVSAKPYSFYIGATRNQTTNTFQWTDGTNVDNTQAPWRTGEPNNIGGDDDCVTMGWSEAPSTRWLDVPCSITSRYICQRRNSVSDTTAIMTTTTDLKIANSLTPTTSSTFPSSSDLITDQVKEVTELQVPVQEKTSARNIHKSPVQDTPAPECGCLLSTVLGTIGGCILGGIGSVVFLIYRKRHRRRKADTTENRNKHSEPADQNNVGCHSVHHPNQASVYVNVSNDENKNQGKDNYVNSMTAPQTTGKENANHHYEFIENGNKASIHAIGDQAAIPYEYEN